MQGRRKRGAGMASAGAPMFGPMEQKPPARDHHHGTPFKEMSTFRKVKFIAKLVICIITFGMAFPNVMSD